MVDQAMAPTRRMRAGTKYVQAVIKVPKKAPTVAAKVATLAKAVKKLNTVSYNKVTMVMEGMVNNQASVIAPYFIQPLLADMRNWVPTFGSTSADITNADKVWINSYKIDCRLSQASEADRITYSAFIVSLKDQANDSSTFDPATGSLALQNGVHYQLLPTNGSVLMNTKFVNIHSYKRFMMGGRAGDQSTPETRDLSFTIRPKEKVISNPRGNVFGVSGLTFPKDPSQNYYFILFNDDSFGDGQVNRISMGGLCSLAHAS